MLIHNADVAAVFSEIADLLDIQGGCARCLRVRCARLLTKSRKVGNWDQMV
ncbi:helix-hairpin-helix domain-containing protein [Paraburkholderia sp. CNPSo 3274]|uniref:helix-hairpin-helix domain-containing protein n=1 Tax=Paraburkholderia sp. CNPSo 3274 TaxID=2940932 RepID=UPI0020B749DA|nr:helix-hairpin-helix domain-containing protein [Paraburkholderia sp. CNPSo 3274]MCP3710078.1 helix-hairpin-helix domain-containing protein [Paraburkholderia sp. CNPSo 3274]